MPARQVPINIVLGCGHSIRRWGSLPSNRHQPGWVRVGLSRLGEQENCSEHGFQPIDAYQVLHRQARLVPPPVPAVLERRPVVAPAATEHYIHVHLQIPTFGTGDQDVQTAAQLLQVVRVWAHDRAIKGQIMGFEAIGRALSREGYGVDIPQWDSLMHGIDAPERDKSTT